MNQALLIERPKEVEQRLALNATWLALVKETLPNLAKDHQWPISLDHCFMRVCLDTALGAPWHTVVKRPAIKHLSDDQIAKAICVAQSLVASPALLQELNQNSIRRRRLLQPRCV
jgi:hypothetical protein